jgi:hypothetical protein
LSGFYSEAAYGGNYLKNKNRFMTTIIVPFYGYVKSKIKGLWNLAKIAKERSLNFSRHDDVGAYVIALDSRKKTLLYLRKAPNISSCLIIDLTNLVSCSIRKQYNSINAGDLNTGKLHDFLSAISLNLRFKNNPGSLSLPLYEAQKDNREDVEQLEKKVKKWETNVLKLLPIQIKESA